MTCVIVKAPLSSLPPKIAQVSTLLSVFFCATLKNFAITSDGTMSFLRSPLSELIKLLDGLRLLEGTDGTGEISENKRQLKLFVKY